MKKRIYYVIGLLFSVLILLNAGSQTIYAEENIHPTDDVLPLICEEIDESFLSDDNIFIYSINSQYDFLSDSGNDSTAYLSYDSAPDCTNDYGYSELSEEMKTAYADYCALAYNYSKSSDFSTMNYTAEKNYVIVSYLEKTASQYNLSNSDMFKVYYIARNNHPEYFWLSNYTALVGGKLILNVDRVYAKASVRTAVQNAITTGLSEYLTAMDEGRNTYEKILIAHNMLIDNVDYAYKPNSTTPESENWAHSISGVFYNFSKNESCEVVCEGYAKAMQYILTAAGIENIYVLGTAGGAHAWNNVKLGDGYFGLDATWDDLGNNNNMGHSYDYFCVPAKYFKEHVEDKKASIGYTFPTLSSSEQYIYYNYYGTNIIGINDASQIRTKLIAAASVVPDKYLAVIFNDANGAKLAEVVPFGSYYITGFGNRAIIDKSLFRTITKPLQSITTSVTGAAITSDEEKKLIITTTVTPNDSDDIIIWTVDSENAADINTSNDGKRAVVIFNKNGKFKLTAKAFKGSAEASVEVTVENITEKESIPDKNVIWINGATIKIANSKDKEVMKTSTWKAGFSASDIITQDSKGKTKKKSGKLIVAVTTTETKPEIVKGKVEKDTEALQIAKASIKKDTVVVTAGKKEGTVYVWVLDTGDEGKYSCNAIEVKLASSKLEAYSDKELSQKYKAQKLAIGSTTTVYFKASDSKDGVHPVDCSYTFTVEDNYKDIISVEETAAANGDYAIRINAIGLDKKKDGKAAKATVTVTCNESNKSVKLTVTVENPIKKVTLSSDKENVSYSDAKGLIIDSQGKDINVTVKVTETLAGSSFKGTAKTKVYVIDSPEAVTVNENGKVKVEKTSDSTIKKIKVSYKGSLKITSKKIEEGSEVKFYLAFVGAEGGNIPIIPVTIK